MTPQRPSGPQRGSSRLSPTEAQTVRRWTVGLAIAAVALLVSAPFTDRSTDIAILVVVTATLATGAVVIRRPIGMRLMLAGTAVAAMLELLSNLVGNPS